VTQGRPILKEGVTESGCDKQGVTVSQESMVIPKDRGKRGLDIQCFNDLPIDVQDTIVKMSTIDGKVDNAEWNKRTAAAIRYQHLFPVRPEGITDNQWA